MSSGNGTKAREIIEHRLREAEILLRLFEITRRALEPLEGKVVTKRFGDAVGAQFDRELPGVRVYYAPEYGWLRVNVYLDQSGVKLADQNRERFDLCRHTTGARFSLGEFDERNHVAAQRERIARRQELLGGNLPEQVQAEADDLRQRFAALVQLVDGLPDEYALRDLCGLKER